MKAAPPEGLGPRHWRRVRQPLYMNLAQQLREGLRLGRWQPREALPSERDLAELLEVSRETARKALDLLCERGLLMRVQGLGTFARPSAGWQRPAAAERPDFAMADEPMQGLAKGQAVQSLGCRLRAADASEARLLGLAAGGAVWHGLSLAGSNDGAPELLSRIQRGDRPPLLPDPAALIEPSELGQSKGAFQLQLHRVEALAANAQQAHYLGMHSGEALLRISHVLLSPEGLVLELRHRDCKGAEAHFSVQASMGKRLIAGANLAY